MSAPLQTTPSYTTTAKYRPIAELGRGGMANVILAVVQGPGGFNKLQVIKRLREELAAQPEFLTMFLDEARLSARINHPNVVQTNEVGSDGQYYFIAMEYLEGQSFESIFRRAKTKLPLYGYLLILTDTLDGLHHAHELVDFDGTPLNVVHRDISPHNIFVTYEGVPKVLDFGIAKASDSSHETRTGTIKGKVPYMPPEQWRGGKSIDRRADIFSVGAILWRVITGVRLWQGMSDLDIFQALSRGEIPSPLTVKPDAPPQLVKICLKAMSITPDDRYESAAALRVELDKYMATLSDRMTHRELGEKISEIFSDKKAAYRSIIEAQLATLSSGSPVLPAIPSRTTSSISALASLPSERSDPDMPDRVSGASQSLSGRGTPGPARLVSSSRGAIAFGAGLALIVVAAASAFVLRPKGGAQAHQDPTASAVPVAAPPLSSAATKSSDTTEVSVQANPSNAKISIDGRVVSNHETLPRDNQKHTILVEAAGFDSQKQTVAFDAASVDVIITLDRRRWWPRAGGNVTQRATPKAPEIATPAAPPPTSTGGAMPQPTSSKRLDSEDPWGINKK